MKKKTRDITVDGVKYVWKLSGGWKFDIDTFEQTFITIWLNKKIIYQYPTIIDQVKPRDIAEIIKSHTENLINKI